jgi:hypothetical protein
MSAVAQQVKNALDEARLMILVVQVLLGFQMRAPFEPGFAHLSHASRGLEIGGLTLLLAAFVCFIAPAPFSEVAFAGETSTEVQTFTSLMLTIGLLPFLAAMSLNVYVTVSTTVSRTTAGLLAAAVALAALWWWYGMGLKDRAGGAARRHVTHQTALADRIERLMTEARMIVPGAQALLGFQFATFFMTGFERLPTPLKALHIVSLSLVGLATILLIAPAAYHRIAENGEDTERVVDVGSRMVLLSLVPLALGIAADVVVVMGQAGMPASRALVVSGGLLVSATALWGAYPAWRRRRR